MPRREPPGQGEQSVPSRRRLLKMAGGATAVAWLAGCSQITHYKFSAEPVELPSSAQSELGYEEALSKSITNERTRAVGGVDVTATITSQIAAYRSTADGEGTASAPGIGVLSTPKATVQGRSFNPLTRLTLANLITSSRGVEFLKQAGLDEVGHERSKLRWERGPKFVGERPGTCLGVETNVESYAGVLGGDPPSVTYLHITRVDVDSVVLASAVHGHDVEQTNRPFVGPEGYLSREKFDGAAETFGRVIEELAYRDA